MAILALACSAVLVALIGTQVWLLAHARDQQNRVRARLDDLARRLAPHAVPPVAATAATDGEGDRLNLMAGQLAPDFALADLEGGQVTRDALLARAKPLLLVFTDPRCGPCYELLPDLGGWQRVYGDRLTIVLVSGGEARSNVAMTAEYGIRAVLLQQEREVAEDYNLAQAPAAVVIQPDGRVSVGPRYGAKAIRQLVADTLGLAMPDAPSREVQVVEIGQRAPRVRRPDLNGQVVEIGGPRNEPTLLVFWNPGCSGCQAVLPEIRALEGTAERLRIVIASRGPIGLNQEAGFRSPVVLDDDHALAQLFGASGTPAALLLDGRGVVATPVARGSEGVRTALAALATAFAPALATG